MTVAINFNGSAKRNWDDGGFSAEPIQIGASSHAVRPSTALFGLPEPRAHQFCRSPIPPPPRQGLANAAASDKEPSLQRSISPLRSASDSLPLPRELYDRRSIMHRDVRDNHSRLCPPHNSH